MGVEGCYGGDVFDFLVVAHFVWGYLRWGFRIILRTVDETD